MLPADTITYTKHIPLSGAGDYIIENSINVKTILSASFLQANISSNTQLVCGSNIFYDNFAKDTPYNEMNFVCNDILKITKTGTDEAMVVVNYVMRDRVNSFDPAVPVNVFPEDPQLVFIANIDAYNKFAVSRTYSFGEVTIALILIPLVLLYAYNTILKAFRKPIEYHK